MLKVLYAASEAYPLVKVGGLGDVAGQLPAALSGLGVDARLVLPAYRGAKKRVERRGVHGPFSLAGVPDPVRVVEGRIPETGVRVYLVDLPRLFDRPGDPYADPRGESWPDNAERFAAFSHAVAALARGLVGFRPDVLHANDWHAAPALALVAREAPSLARVFTVHNLAYQGCFPLSVLPRLGFAEGLLPLFAHRGEACFLKAGLLAADWITTVSPTYAREILTPAFGMGLEAVLRARADRLVGILNGIDARLWDPRRDRFIAYRYGLRSLERKRWNRPALLRAFGLVPGGPVVGMIGRLTEQKGFDLVLEALPGLVDLGLRLAILGRGEAALADRLRRAARRYPGRVGVRLAFDEALAHRVTAGADLFFMPSRFEPCGLNQMYAQRYGTVPVAHRVGGLADTIVDASPAALVAGRATGVLFDEASPGALLAAAARALSLLARPRVWRRLARAGMRRDFGWPRRAEEYLALYRRARSEKRR